MLTQTLERISDMVEIIPEPAHVKQRSCQVCGGIGFFVSNLLDTKHPKFGRAQRCHCNPVPIAHSARLTDDERAYTFDSSPVAPDRVRQIRKLVEQSHGMAILCGEYGVGKSGLLKSAVNANLDAGHSAIYINTIDLLERIKASFGTNQSAESILNEFKDVHLLAIDEVEKINLTDWSFSILMSLYDHRYRYRNSTITLMATNLKPRVVNKQIVLLRSGSNEQMGYLDARLRDCHRILIDGGSQRGKRA